MSVYKLSEVCPSIFAGHFFVEKQQIIPNVINNPVADFFMFNLAYELTDFELVVKHKIILIIELKCPHLYSVLSVSN